MSSKLSFSSLRGLWGNFPKGTTGIINLLQTTQSLSRRWQYSWGACAFQGMYQTLLFFFFQREPVLHFKEVKGELKCFKKSLRDPLQPSSAIPLWSACHPAGCFSRLDLSLRLVPGGGFLPAVELTLQLSLCKHRKERDGTAALWLVWGIRKWKVPVCFSVATSGALQLMELSHVSPCSLLGCVNILPSLATGLQTHMGCKGRSGVWNYFAERTSPETLGEWRRGFPLLPSSLSTLSPMEASTLVRVTHPSDPHETADSEPVCHLQQVLMDTIQSPVKIPEVSVGLYPYSMRSMIL